MPKIVYPSYDVHQLQQLTSRMSGTLTGSLNNNDMHTNVQSLSRTADREFQESKNGGNRDGDTLGNQMNKLNQLIASTNRINE